MMRLGPRLFHQDPSGPHCENLRAELPRPRIGGLPEHREIPVNGLLAEDHEREHSGDEPGLPKARSAQGDGALRRRRCGGVPTLLVGGLPVTSHGA